MGYIIYGAGAEYEIEDRTLAHLKVAVGLKFRQGESFYVSWINPVEKGSGRVSLWASPNIPLIFRFSGSRSPELNPVWLNVMLETSRSPRGMAVVPEQDALAYAAKNNISDHLTLHTAPEQKEPQPK